jgi:hypothetical protein
MRPPPGRAPPPPRPVDADPGRQAWRVCSPVLQSSPRLRAWRQRTKRHPCPVPHGARLPQCPHLHSTPLRFTPRRIRSMRRSIPLCSIPAPGSTRDWRMGACRWHLAGTAVTLAAAINGSLSPDHWRTQGRENRNMMDFAESQVLFYQNGRGGEICIYSETFVPFREKWVLTAYFLVIFAFVAFYRHAVFMHLYETSVLGMVRILGNSGRWAGGFRR